MATFMRSILKRASEFFQNIEKKKLILIIAVAATVIVAGVVGAVLLNQVKYTVLYSGLEAGEAGTIKTVLDGMDINSKVQGTSVILVPEEQADELRIQLASEGYPSTGLNYDIFSNSSALGSTDLERRTYLQYQLQENIRVALRHMDKVQDSIVMVNLASDSAFVVSDNQTQASAAVTLKLKNGETLTPAEAKTIGEFVMKCVPELVPENVSIVDSQMVYYDITEEGQDNTAFYTATQQELTEQMKDTLTKQVLNVLEPAIGKGNVAASVNLNLDFDKQTVNKVEFAPPVDGESEGIVRSSEELYSAVGTSETDTGSVGTDTNGMGTPSYQTGDIANSNEVSTSNTYNYELNEIRTQIEKAQGSVQDLSVSVLVNSKVEGINGYMETVKNLVANSIGVKPDYITVELMPFVDNTDLEDAFAQSQASASKISRNEMIATIVKVVAIVAGIVIIIRLLLKRRERSEEEEALGVGQMVAVTAGDMGDLAFPEENGFDLSELVFKKSSEVEKIEELMEKYPDTVAQTLRSWLAEDN